MTVEKQEHDRNTLEEKGIIKKIIKGGGFTFAGKILGGGLIYVSHLITAWILGAENFGLFFLGLAIISLCGNVARCGMDYAAVKYVAIYHREGDKNRLKGLLLQAFFIPIVTSIILSGIIFVSSHYVSSHILNKPELTSILKVLLLSLPVLLFMNITAFATTGIKTMKYLVLITNLFQPSVNILLICAFFFGLGYKLNGVLFSYPISMFLAALLSSYYLIKLFPEIIDKKIKSVFETKTLLKFSLPISLAGFLAIIIFYIDTIMLGYWKSASEIGLYNAAAKTAMIVGLIGTSFHPIFNPIISDLVNRSEMDRLENIFRILTRWGFTLTVPAFTFVSIFSHEIMSLFGQEFTPGQLPLILLAFAQMFSACTGATGPMLLMSGKQNVIFYNSIIILLVSIGLNFLFIPTYGATGAAIATCLAIVVLNLLMIIEVYAIFRIYAFDLNYAKVFLISAFSGLVTYFIKSAFNIQLPPMVFLSGGLFFFIAVFSILLRLFGLLKEDILLLKSIKNAGAYK